MYFRPIKDIYFSFKKGDEGFSARKLSAFACMTTALYMCAFNLPEADRLHGVYALLLCSLLCFGIVTWQQIVELRQGTKTVITETTSKTQSNETTDSNTSGASAV